MKKFSYNIIIPIALLLAMTVPSFSQGSIANRYTEGASCLQPVEIGDSSGSLMNINNPYFNSYKDFAGAEEQYKRVNNGTEHINHTYIMDLFLAQNVIRAQSVPDKIRTKKTGAYAQGDAAFTEYAVINVMAIRF